MVKAGSDCFFDHWFGGGFERQVDADGCFFAVYNVREVADVCEVDVSALYRFIEVIHYSSAS